MDEVFIQYKKKKYFKCLELMRLLPESDDVVENFLIDNNRLICESLIRIVENDPDKIWEIQEQHFMLFEKVISMDSIGDSVPLQLKLNLIFNLTFWLSFYSDNEFDISGAEEYLKLLHRGLLSVLGRNVSSEATSDVMEKVIKNTINLRELIPNKDQKTVLLILELVVVIILFIMKLERSLLNKCLSIVDLFIKESKYVVKSLESVEEFMEVKPTSLCLCKFSLCGAPTVLSELNLGVVDCLHLLKCVLLYLMEDFRGSLKSLQNNKTSNVKNLWNYLVALNGYELENWGLCLGFLTKMSTLVLEKNLKARCHILHGKLNCIERNHKEALQQFKNALMLCSHCPIIYCYIGQVYGRMGIFDLMQENFEKLVQELLQAFQLEEPEDDFRANFETTVLSWIHPVDEITELESHYALAVSYGLNENFKNASEAYERVLQLWNADKPGRKKRIIELPSFLTLLHEAAVINLMLGNLVRAEQIALDAIDRYIPQEFNQKHQFRKSLLCKDMEWLQRVIQQELLETVMEPKELSNEIIYSEDLIFVFPQNMIGLLILSEIQRIQGIEDYKTTLSTVFSLFSKYLAGSQNKGQVGEDGKCLLTLVRALAGKTCIKIATIQMELSDHPNVEKMLKRALSCNKGDKDALYKYYKFLMKLGRSREALQLWNTFFKEKETICVDSLQSFSLKYFLTDKITKRELEKIKQEIESSAIHLL